MKAPKLKFFIIMAQLRFYWVSGIAWQRLAVLVFIRKNQILAVLVVRGHQRLAVLVIRGHQILDDQAHTKLGPLITKEDLVFSRSSDRIFVSVGFS